MKRVHKSIHPNLIKTVNIRKKTKKRRKFYTDIFRNRSVTAGENGKLSKHCTTYKSPGTDTHAYKGTKRPLIYSTRTDGRSLRHARTHTRTQACPTKVPTHSSIISRKMNAYYSVRRNLVHSNIDQYTSKPAVAQYHWSSVTTLLCFMSDEGSTRLQRTHFSPHLSCVCFCTGGLTQKAQPQEGNEKITAK